jgi:small-conductance mechanosensitive channel
MATGFETTNLTLVIQSIFVIVCSVLIGNLLYSVLRRSFDRRITKRSSKIISRIVEYLVLGVLVYFGLVVWLGVDFTAFTASLGIMGVIIAFSSTQIIQNTLAGILISVQRPIQVEDWIEIGAAPETAVSKVKDISLMRTTLRNRDGKIIFVPNNILLTSRVTNYTKSGFVEVPLVLTVPKDANVEKVKEIMLSCASSHPKVLPNVSRQEKKVALKLLHFLRFYDNQTQLSNLHPYVIITDISNSKIVFSLRIWIREVHLRERIISELLTSIQKKFSDEEIVV